MNSLSVRGRSRRARASRTFGVVLVAALATSTTALGAVAAASTKSWTQYFPTNIGRSCSISLAPLETTEGSDVITTLGTAIEELTSVHSTSEGTVYTFERTVHLRQTESHPADKLAHAPLSTTQTLEYLALKNGTVQAPLDNVASYAGTIVYGGHLDYPSIPEILSGHTPGAVVPFADSGTTPTSTADIESVTKNHVNTLRGAIHAHIAGTFRSSLHTPAGTYANVVGIHFVFTGVVISNGIDATATNLVASSFLKNLNAVTSTLWYAPGRGIVSIWTVGSTGRTTIEDTTCAG